MGEQSSRSTRFPREALSRFPKKALSIRLREQAISREALVVGAVSGFASLVLYDQKGYSNWMLVLWLTGLAGLSVFLWSKSSALPRIARLDLLAPVGLVAAFAPLYLISLYDKPIQVNSDEVAISNVAEHYGSVTEDPFGVSNYLGRPTMLFLGWGRLGELLGGIDLYHMRLLHALFGLLTIAACYAFLRQLLPRRWAMFATAVVGVSHSMFMISRLAMRENTAVLIEVVALALLFWGLRNDHLFVTFWGGVVAGLSFYVYFPARATFPLWIAFLVVLALTFRREFKPRRLAVLGGTALAGFVLMAGPNVIAERNVPHPDPGNQPQKDSLMLFELGREKQKEWVFKSSFADAYKINVKQGLTAFNNEVVDNGFIYANYGHGFVDPLTGILLWLGVGLIAVRLVRRRADEGALLMLLSFVILWLSLALVVNKAPNYTRLLITLPFVAYFVTEAVRWLAGRWRSVPYAPAVLAGAALLALVVWNLAIAQDFISKGQRYGEPNGSTGRYAAAHRNTPGVKFYLAVSDQAIYYDWGGVASVDRLQFFAKTPEQVTAIDPYDLRNFRAPAPFYLFMTRDMWQNSAKELADAYPRGRIRNVMPDGTRVVLEVLS